MRCISAVFVYLLALLVIAAGQRCSLNETYNECGTACPLNCSNYFQPPTACTEQCVSGCFCNSSYVRDANHRCILTSDCPGRHCPPNQTYNECGTACPLNCTNYFEPQFCTKQCVPGCFCNPDYVLNARNVCVSISACPKPQCPPTQKFTTCGSACPLTCSNYNNPPICTLQCVPGCFCESGYVWNSITRRCVKPSQCNSTCPVDEYLETCANHCQPTCEAPYHRNCLIFGCQERCVCKEPLIRQSLTGKCIEMKYCPVSCNDENAVRKKCAPKCPETCQNNYDCKCSKECAPGCVCKKDFTKDEISGKCVPTKSCENLRCGLNEVYKQCGTKCPKTCTNKDFEVLCIAGCQSGCFCEDGFVRDEKTGKCIKPEHCPQCCQNETYSAQGIDCQTCSNYKFVRCALQQEYKCYCLPGYVRDDFTRQCILPADCPQGCGDNEAYQKCGTKCPKTCANKDALVKCEEGCASGCFCKDGHVRYENTGQCIKSGECPVCGKNESYRLELDPSVDCGTCANYMVAGVCAPRSEFRCYCYPGYFRDDDGACVALEDCRQARCTKPNEEYVPCDPGPCEPNCQHTELKQCPEFCKLHGCQCKEGFLRDNVTRACVPKGNCP